MEWVALILLLGLGLAALVAVAPLVDGRSLGGLLAHRIGCALKVRCGDGAAALERTYGPGPAGLVRAHAPNLLYEEGERALPVDWRDCRRSSCAEAPDEANLDVHRSGTGARATVFTRLSRRDGRTFIQYWLYFPDSKSVVAGSDRAWEAFWLLPRLRGIVSDAPSYPGYHRDDWESFQVRLDPDGSAWTRASSHGHYQGCKEERCRNRWVGATGWTRVSRGSHAGHIPFRNELRPGRSTLPRVPRGKTPGAPPARLRRVPLYGGVGSSERTSTSDGLRLIPLETHDRRRYRRRAEGIAPPWDKDVYHHPEDEGS